MPKMSEVIVHKLDANGELVWRYSGIAVARTAHCLKLEAEFDRDQVELGYATFERGDRFIERYYDDRWYNIYTIYEGRTQEIKGWYCNICRPAKIEEDLVSFEDLALDLWSSPHGQVIVLDRDEFENLSLQEEERAHCELALDALLVLADQGQLPR